MTYLTHPISRWIRLGLLAMSLCVTLAFADDHDRVNELLRDGKLPEALASADKYLASNPRDARMRFLKALIQQEAGRHSEAIASYTRLVEDYPELPEPYNNLAVLYLAQGQSEKAREALELAKRNSRTYAITYEKLGDVYAHLASQSFSYLLQLDNGDTLLAPKPVLIRQLIAGPLQPATAASARPIRRPAPAASRAK